MKKLILSSLVAATLASASFANDGIYAGLIFGQSKTDTGLSVNSGANLDEKDNSYGVLVGYQFNKYFGAEMAYQDFGSAQLNFSNGASYNVNGTTINATSDGKLVNESNSLSIGVVAKYPLHKYINPFVKLGYHRFDTEAVLSTAANTVKAKDDGFDTFYAIGLESNITDNITARVAFEEYNYDDNGEIKNTSFSLIYKF